MRKFYRKYFIKRKRLRAFIIIFFTGDDRSYHDYKKSQQPFLEKSINDKNIPVCHI